MRTRLLIAFLEILNYNLKIMLKFNSELYLLKIETIFYKVALNLKVKLENFSGKKIYITCYFFNRLMSLIKI